ncbi:MAG: NAD-dependent epimerase/dehydratase family protein, partial [Bacillota bacterium]
MRVLVIGGNRFVGRHLVKKLLQGGHEVVLFNRGQHSSPLNSEVQLIHGDRKQHDVLCEKLAGESFDAVVDMIAYDAADV